MSNSVMFCFKILLFLPKFDEFECFVSYTWVSFMYETKIRRANLFGFINSSIQVVENNALQ